MTNTSDNSDQTDNSTGLRTPSSPLLNKERLTISISPELLDLVDRRVDGVYLRNRSHVIESMLSEAFDKNGVEQAVFLAGGDKAQTFKPCLTDYLARCRDMHIGRLALITGYWGRVLTESLGAEETSGLDVRFGHAETGDAGALRDNRQLFAPGTLMIMNSLSCPAVDLSDFIQFHQRNNRVATVCYTDQAQSRGLYIFAPDIFRYIPSHGFAMFQTDVFPSLEEYQLLIEYHADTTR